MEGVMLAASSERMRVAISGNSDPVELSRFDGCWYAEGGHLIEIEALVPLAGTDIARLCAEMYPLSAVAGRTLTASGL
jgi:hypothetical protein